MPLKDNIKGIIFCASTKTFIPNLDNIHKIKAKNSSVNDIKSKVPRGLNFLLPVSSILLNGSLLL